MARRKSESETPERLHVEIIGEPTDSSSSVEPAELSLPVEPMELNPPVEPAEPKQSCTRVVNVGKIPGEIKEVPVNGRVKIRNLFKEINIKNLDHCEIQRNGAEANLDDLAEPGDTILAIARIRGN